MSIILLTDAGFGLYSAGHLLKEKQSTAILITCGKHTVKSAKKEPILYTDIHFFDKARGLRRYKKNALQSMFKIIDLYIHDTNITEIWTHEIYSLHWNIAAHYILSKRPDIKLYLIPDGTFNMFLKPIKLKEKISQKLMSICHDRYQPFCGDWYGVDAKKGKKYRAEAILLPLGMPNQYNPKRVKYFKFNHKKTRLEKPKHALIVEQSLYDRGYIGDQERKKIISKIKKSLETHHISQAYIIRHPKAKERDFYDPDFIELNYHESSLEDHVLSQNYAYIYTCFSTILLLQPSLPLTGFYSIGLNYIKNMPNISNYKKNLKTIGITTL